VSSEKNFVAVIRQHYATTLNLGMPGEGPLHMLAVLREYAMFLRPKVVLWFYSEASTFTELRYERESGILLDYLTDDFTQALVGRQVDLDQAMMAELTRQGGLTATRQAKTRDKKNKVIDKLPAFIRLSAVREELGLIYGKTAESREHLSGGQAADLAMDVKLLRDVLSKASSRVSEWGGKLYFVYLPGWKQYAGSPDVGVKARAEVLGLVENLAIPIIDTYSAFQAHPDPVSLFPFRGPGRYNEDGHRLVGETVLKSLASST
jgi:hypothetical protein